VVNLSFCWYGFKKMSQSIDKWRRKIDILDRELTRLLNIRTGYAIEIGKIKKKESLDIYDPKREEEVIANINSVTCKHLTPKALIRVFERIIDETRRAERLTRTTKSPRV